MKSTVYVASKNSNPLYALDKEQIVEACATGPDPLGDAKSYARDEVYAYEKPVYIYRVTVEAVGVTKVEKAVTYSPAE